jgi:hypothetical protein
MKHTRKLRAALLALGSISASQAATIQLSNADFNTGTGLTATSWIQTDGTGANSAPSNYWQGAGLVSGITTGAIYVKSDGANFIQQAFTQTIDLTPVDATTFNSYTVAFDYGFRHDGTFNASNHTIRVSLWNVTDGVEVAGTDLVIAPPVASGANSLTGGSFNLNYDNTAGTLAGDQLAIRFTSTSADLGGNAWQRTAILDNVSITAVPEPSAALLGGLGVLALFLRRRG